MTLRNILTISAVALFAVGLLFTLYMWQASTVSANPSNVLRNTDFMVNNSIATGTTNRVFMTPGTGTTTITMDAGFSIGRTFDTAVAAVQLTPSSTELTRLVGRVQHSSDNIDWYDFATSSLMTGTVAEFTIVPNSTSTNPDNGDITNNFSIHTIATPLRYTRVIFTLPQNSTNATIWAELVPQKELR